MNTYVFPDTGGEAAQVLAMTKGEPVMHSIIYCQIGHDNRAQLD
jgi:hypothetical protein